MCGAGGNLYTYLPLSFVVNLKLKNEVLKFFKIHHEKVLNVTDLYILTWLFYIM